MNKRKLVLGAVGIFLVGALCGALSLEVIHMRYAPFLRLAHDPQSFIMDRLDAKLDLTPEQKTKIAPLVAQMLQELHATRVPCRDAEEKIIQTSQDRIDEVLTPEQVEKHKIMEENFKKHRQEMHAP
jgi:hypothetical protein